METDQANGRVVGRAVTIWKRLLANPQYKATSERDSREDQDRMGQAGMMAQMIPSNATAGLLDKFGEVLAKRLHEQCEKSEYVSVGVDYGPDGTLTDCAKEVGLDMQFPWKTHMHIMRNAVSVSAGYGVEAVYHYPLSADRWLIARLTGGDVSKVIGMIEDGVETPFEVETPVAVP